MYRGIDVSSHQGYIDWKQVSGAGIEFAMIRCGFGNSMKQKDKYADANIQGCIENGIHVGAYWFSYALREEHARQEAQLLMEVLEPYKKYVSFPLAYDLEYDSVRYAQEQGYTIDKKVASIFADAFLSEIERGGYYGINYMNPDYMNRFFTDDVKSKYDLWLAHWVENTPHECGIWQYTSDGSVPGISGRVDMNIAYMDYPALCKNSPQIDAGRPENEKRYNSLNDMPQWLRKEIEPLVMKGVISGKDSGLDLSEDMCRTLIMCERMVTGA